MSHDDEPLTPSEIEDLGFDSAMPPDTMEARILRELRARGLVSRTPGRGRLMAACILLILIAGGSFVAGRWTAGGTGPVPPGTRYLLLLHSPIAENIDPEVDRARAREYGRWARREPAAGRMIDGKRLGDQTWLLAGSSDGPTATPGRSPSAGSRAGGYFILSADSPEAAMETALTCPHLKYGGEIELRPIR